MVAEFLRFWLTWAGMVLLAALGAALWAARAGHFRDQERARSLALWAEVEGEVPWKGKDFPLSPGERGRGEGEMPDAPSPGLRPPSPSGRGKK